MLDKPRTDWLSHLTIEELIQICLSMLHDQPDLAPHIVHQKFNQVNNPIVTSEPVKERDFKMKSLASVLIGLFEADDFDGHQLQAPVCHHGQTREFQGLEYPVNGC